ncbi:MAG TPA: biopolymer transporter ExbD [Longimicrobiaceae bacterium]|nr:biopolymer transporter ExbD [Longimicrobiaceae bacterium]
MAMVLVGRKGGALTDINVIPMIDVLLVLLIIFMVVQQGMQRGLAVQVPPVSPPAHAGPEQFVLEVRAGPEYLLNHEPIAPAQLEFRLREVFAPRARKVVLVRGEESLSYGQVVHALDAARAAGVEVVGVVPRTSKP